MTLDPNPDPDSCTTRGAPVKYCTRETRSLARGEAAIAQHLAKLEVCLVKLANAPSWLACLCRLAFLVLPHRNFVSVATTPGCSHRLFVVCFVFHCNGIAASLICVELLQARHLQHVIFYGTNTKRMDSQCIANFSSGVENREASIRIPFKVSSNSFGFYEDRRPASNMDPYLVTMMLVCTTHGIPLPLKVCQLLSGN